MGHPKSIRVELMRMKVKIQILSWMILVMLCPLFVPCHIADAWTAEEYYESVSQLPESVKNSLPIEKSFEYGIRTGAGLFTLLDTGDNTRQVYLFRGQGKSADPSQDIYWLECQSAPLPFLGTTASIGSSGSDTLYLLYWENNPWYCATFERDAKGQWKLVGVQTSTTFYHKNAFGVYGEVQGPGGKEDTLRYLPGNLDVDLSTVDVSKIPATLETATEMIDTSGCAMIRTAKAGRLAGLYAKPRTTALLLGEYCQGTPVSVLDNMGKWSRVSIAGTEGYLETAHLVFGAAMVQIEPAFWGKGIAEEKMPEGIILYAKPNKNAETLGVLDGSNTYNWNMHIIGIVDDEWYHILCDDGLYGYAETKFFSEGNG